MSERKKLRTRERVSETDKLSSSGGKNCEFEVVVSVK